MEAWLRAFVGNLTQRYLGNEKGQDVLTWLIILFVLWLIIAGRRVVVQ